MKREKINAPDQSLIHLNAWTLDEPRADIILSHGFQEHSGRYEKEAAFFNRAGFNFLAYDLRGHGLSDGQPRAYIDDFSLLTEDLETVYTHYVQDNRRPVFLFGHSLGGLVTVSFLINKPRYQEHINGMLLSAPLLMPNADMAPLLQKLSSVVSKLMPKLKTVKLDPNELSRDPGVVAGYINDPLVCHQGIHARTGYRFLQEMKKNQKLFDQIHTPFIIQHSKADRLTEHAGSQLLFETASSEDKVFVSLDEYKHEITRDQQNEQVLEDYLVWMEQRLQTRN